MDVAPVVAINQSINTIISDVHYFTERKEKNGVVHSAREMKASGYHRIKLLNPCFALALYWSSIWLLSDRLHDYDRCSCYFWTHLPTIGCVKQSTSEKYSHQATHPFFSILESLLK
jgi:hypothetical protein